jgi:hypothetical protein
MTDFLEDMRLTDDPFAECRPLITAFESHPGAMEQMRRHWTQSDSPEVVRDAICQAIKELIEERIAEVGLDAALLGMPALHLLVVKHGMSPVFLRYLAGLIGAV